MAETIRCKHVDGGLEPPVIFFPLDDSTSLHLCEYCYSRFKAFVIQGVLGDLAKEFAREISRLNFTKR